MDHVLIKLITRAARAGTEFTVTDETLLVRGTPPGDELRARADDVRALLTAEHCAACGAPAWIHEHATAIPWCRPCAHRRGTQLLRAEQPHLVDQEVA